MDAGRKPLGAVLLLLMMSLVVVMFAQSVAGQVSSGSSIPVGLGFSQSTVAPVSSGIPVYSVGDQLWLESYGNGSVDALVTPPPSSGGSGTAVSITGVPGDTPTLVLTFSSQAVPGLWSLSVTNSSGSETSLQFYLVEGYAPLTMTGYGLTPDGQLSLNYTLGDEAAYDISTCTAGNVSTSTASVPIPADDGGGTLLLTLNGSAVSARPEGNGQLFTFWLDLQQGYAFETANQTFATRTETVAETQPALVTEGSGGAFISALQYDLPLATGQFTLAANFRGASGVTTEDTTVLLPGGNAWLWLRGCSASSNVDSTSFTLTSSLQQNASGWPRYVVALYKEMGLGLFSVTPVDVAPASIHLVASPWGEPLTDTQVSVSGVSRYSVGNGTVYIVASQYPATVSLNESHTYTQEVTVEEPYSTATVQVPSARIVVDAYYGTDSVSDVPVTLNDSFGEVGVQTTGSGGEAVFFVPPGNFTVSGTYKGQVETSLLDVNNATQGSSQSYPVTLQFGGGVVSPSGGGGLETLALVVVLVLGVILSGLVWTLAYRRKRLS